MKIRGELHLNGREFKVILVARPEEKADHLAMKLAAVAMFMSSNPIVEPSADHPALQQADFRPDVMTLNDGGEIVLWIECGEVSVNKLDKVTRRFPSARIIVIKSRARQATQLRDMLSDIRNGARIEIWTWPDGAFDQWLRAMQDKTEIFGEADEKSFNLVVNHEPYVTDLVSV